MSQTSHLPDFYTGSVPATDAFNKPITDEFIQGKIHGGAIRFMTPDSHKQYGVGKGNHYKKNDEGKWTKVN